ncbi:MAG: UvrD-helicase domain-containing protein [Planctomycetaceae bacterium]|nr:UvrD-helicase domain-containing protein [Planctomycetaceae bacterium]
MIPPPKSTSGLNEGQRAALDLSRDLLVDAGAGAGKTQVLALRVLALLELELAGISEIVAFTFTDKAAAEMRDRVQRLLLERIAELESLQRQSREPLPQLKALTRARAEFSLNRITTVHGFCHRLLSDLAWEAGL